LVAHLNRPFAPSKRDRATLIVVALGALTGLACANVKGDQGHPGAGGAGGPAGLPMAGVAGTSGAAGTGMMPPPPRTCDAQRKCMDFSLPPIFDAAPSDAAALFGAAPAGDGPCITEPEDGALFPNNWLRPRVKFVAAAPGALHEIRFHTDAELDDLIVFTTHDTWTMPLAIWQRLAADVRETPITVTVRAAGAGASSATFTIAPVGAPGSIVFWAGKPAEIGAANPTSTSTSASLRGFAPGAETTQPTLSAADVQMQTRGPNNELRNVSCVGCHVATPDGQAVSFLDSSPFSMGIAGVSPGRTGLIPLVGTTGGVVSLGGLDAIRQRGLGIFSFSKAHWKPNDRLVVTPYYLDAPCGPYSSVKEDVRLVWIDLEAPLGLSTSCPTEGVQFGTIARRGDPRGAANPTWSHDGKTIVYSSTTAGREGRLGAGGSDLYAVPFGQGANGRGQGGDAAPLSGAAESNFDEYYPAFSPDDALVVFDRVPTGTPMYANAAAELFVVPAAGAASAARLAANDPPKCGALASPGVNNHWARWAPVVQSAPGSKAKFYWLVFSSNRYGTPPVVVADREPLFVSQLYVTAIVVDDTATRTFPAIYLWNQDAATLNTTPDWGTVPIPLGP
jgi:hypothetical protein